MITALPGHTHDLGPIIASNWARIAVGKGQPGMFVTKDVLTGRDPTLSIGGDLAVAILGLW